MSRVSDAGLASDLAEARQIVAVTAMDLRWAARSTRAALVLAADKLGVPPRRARALYHGEARRVGADELGGLRQRFEDHLTAEDRTHVLRQAKLRRLMSEWADRRAA